MAKDPIAPTNIPDKQYTDTDVLRAVLRDAGSEDYALNVTVGGSGITMTVDEIDIADSPANTARAATDNVILVQNLDEAGQVLPSSRGGGVEADALRVTLASDSTGVLSVDDNGSSITVDSPSLDVVGGGTEATALRVTLASDSTGVVSVDDNGTSLTVDGTVTADAGTGFPSVATAGSSAQTTGVQVMGSDGTNAQIPFVAAANGSTAATDNATAVQIRNSSGAVIDTFGGCTEATAGSAHASLGPQIMVSDATNAQRLGGLQMSTVFSSSLSNYYGAWTNTKLWGLENGTGSSYRALHCVDLNGAESYGPGITEYGLLVGASPLLFDAKTNVWRRARANGDVTLLSSAARTSTVSSTDTLNHNYRGLKLVIDVTAITDTPSVVFTIEGKDETSGKYYTILASAAITGTGTTVLTVYPGITASANVSANDILPRTWRVTATHGDADSITYSVGALPII